MKTKRPRDSQQRKVYRAEGELPRPDHEQFASIADAREYLNRVLRDPICRNVQVCLKYGGRSWSWCRSKGDYYEIALCPLHQHRLVLLHELAHAIAPRNAACHGWEFCLTYITLVRTHIGTDRADLLCAAFRKHRVRWTPKPTVLRVPMDGVLCSDARLAGSSS